MTAQNTQETFILKLSLTRAHNTRHKITSKYTLIFADFKGCLVCHSLFSNPANFAFFIMVALVQEATKDSLRKVDVLCHLYSIQQETILNLLFIESMQDGRTILPDFTCCRSQKLDFLKQHFFDSSKFQVGRFHMTKYILCNFIKKFSPTSSVMSSVCCLSMMKIFASSSTGPSEIRSNNGISLSLSDRVSITTHHTRSGWVSAWICTAHNR